MSRTSKELEGRLKGVAADAAVDIVRDTIVPAIKRLIGRRRRRKEEAAMKFPENLYGVELVRWVKWSPKARGVYNAVRHGLLDRLLEEEQIAEMAAEMAADAVDAQIE